MEEYFEQLNLARTSGNDEEVLHILNDLKVVLREGTKLLAYYIWI